MSRAILDFEVPPTLRLLLPLCVLLGAVRTSSAQEVDESALDAAFEELDLADEFELLQEEDVVVSATTHVQPIDESPSAIFVLSRKEILASGYDNLLDLMRLVPGADVWLANQTHGAVGLRSGTTIAGDLLLVLVDGRDVALHLFGQPQWMAPHFQVEEIGRIEVIRGPASTLYGANALQGVVNIVTREPGRAPLTVESTLSGNSPEHLRASLRAHGTVGPVGYFLSLGALQRSPFEAPLEVGASALQARGRLVYWPTEDLRLEAELGYVEGQGDFFTVIGSGRAANLWPYLRARLKSEDWDVGLVLDRNDTRFDIDVRVALPAPDGGEPVPLLKTPPILHDTESAEIWAKYGHVFGGRLRTTVGVSARAIHHLPRTTVTCPEGVSFDDWRPEMCSPTDLVETRLGAFGQGEYRVGGDLTLTGGVRLDLNSLTPEPGISPLLAAVQRLGPDHALRLTLGRAYRKPVYLETNGHAILEPAPGVPEEVTRRLQYLFAYGLGNPNLKNEKRTSLGLGWRGRMLEGRLRASTDAYVGVIEDATGLDTSSLRIETFGGVPRIPEDATVQYRTFDRPGYFFGAEGTLTYAPVEGLTLGLWYAFDQSYEYRPPLPGGPAPAEGETLVLREGAEEPDHRLTGTVRYRAPAGTTLSMNVHWSSRYVDYLPNPESVVGDPTRISMGEAWLMSVHFGHRFQLEAGQVELGFDVYDLLDQRIFEQVGMDRPGGGTFGAQPLRRRITLFVRGTF